MEIRDLLKMDMGEAIQWIIDNEHDFKLVKVKATTDKFIREVEQDGQLSREDMVYLKSRFIEFLDELGLVT